jgi:tetratricopeptide (TPR) repeat protein
MLRRIVAGQPVNQAAWIWLSAVTDNRAEAESALARARQINPTHDSLLKAEQWLGQRFSDAEATRPTPLLQGMEPPPIPTPIPPVEPIPAPAPEPVSARLFGSFNAFALGMALVAIIIGVLVLFLGLFVELSGAAHASPSPLAASFEAVKAAIVVDEAAARLQADLTAAQSRRDWLKARDILRQMQQATPDSPAIQEQLAEVSYRAGLLLRNRGLIEEAQRNFSQALALNPQYPAAQQEMRLATAYAAGAAAHQAGEWANAATAFESVLAINPHYLNGRDLLYSAYYNLGLAHRAAGRPDEAKAALAQAINLRPDVPEARKMLAQTDFDLLPRTPAAGLEDRLILVGLAEQRMWVFEGNKKVFDFVVSTGEPGSETAVGEFEILDKIDVAYASAWNLDMPYWMGIYWAGETIENGIHALPIVKHTGYKLWDGFLGQRVSYGCVILGDDDAATLYNWARIGTKVKIVPSLADWSAQPAAE